MAWLVPGAASAQNRHVLLALRGLIIAHYHTSCVLIVKSGQLAAGYGQHAIDRVLDNRVGRIIHALAQRARMRL